MKKYYINTMINAESNGGEKAKADINIILEKLGYKEIFLPKIKKTKHIFKLLLGIFNCLVVFVLPKKSILIYQIPSYRSCFFEKFILHMHSLKKYILVIVIHDIEELRKIYIKKKSQILTERELHKYSDVIICHNDSMKKYLIDSGIKEDKVFAIKIFDYIMDNELKIYERVNRKFVISIAGNLTYLKSAYVYLLDELDIKNIEIRLYGFGLEDKKFNNNKIKYYGFFSPKDIPNQLSEGWGLVWDGNSLDSCSGETGEYLAYINQHKVSLYLSAGLPVIIWKGAGLAKFIEENEVGITISSLKEIESVLSNISDEQYSKMVRNTVTIANKLRNGYFTKSVMNEVEDYIKLNFK